MSERLPLPAELFRGRSSRGVQDQAEVIRLMRLGDRGEYIEAAHEASNLLQSYGRDIRLTAVYLVGIFLEGGPAGLPELFDCIATEFVPRAGEGREGARTREAALKWLCRSLTSQIAFHTASRGETWEQWVGEISSAQLAAITDKCQHLVETYPICAAPFAKIGRWSQDRLSPASARRRREAEAEAELPEPEAPISQDPKLSQPSWDEPEPAVVEPEPAVVEPEPDVVEPEPDGFGHDGFGHDGFGRDGFGHDDFGHDDFGHEGPGHGDFGHGGPGHDDFGHEGPGHGGPGHGGPGHGRPGHGGPLPSLGPEAAAAVGARVARPAQPRSGNASFEVDSPALLELIEKLQGFELLVERGELDKAAIIANDIQGVIENFDPLVYLPAIFARYFQLLSKIIVEVEARWDDGDTTARRVLQQFYRADLDGFVNE